MGETSVDSVALQSIRRARTSPHARALHGPANDQQPRAVSEAFNADQAFTFRLNGAGLPGDFDASMDWAARDGAAIFGDFTNSR